ncbi:UNVERIFIED_CONTAM: hypothetical protein HDU68_009774 [Siphonaria sp. JEL0065]|nr:hypothetical protein HDU68_009774 [Siphonaria sp. JEL0065]
MQKSDDNVSDSEGDDLPPIPFNRNHTSSECHMPDVPSGSVLKIQSFGHRFGPLQPPPALLFNARTLPNPPKHIRTRSTGQSKSLQESFMSHAEVQSFFDNATTAIHELLKESSRDNDNKGIQVVDIAVCCEMGRHRSVAICERLAKHKWGKDVHVILEHRDIARNKKK